MKRNLTAELCSANETFSCGASYYTSAADKQAALGPSENHNQTPRGGSRGAVTRIFPALVQEEQVSFGEGYPSQPCVSTLLSGLSSCCAADSKPTERKLTPMKSNSFLRFAALLALTALAVPRFCETRQQDLNITQPPRSVKADLQAGDTDC